MRQKFSLSKFLTISILVIVSRCYDIFTTYTYIPDLKGEINPIVSVLHLGWIEVLIVQFLGVSLVIYTAYVYCFKTVTLVKYDKSISQSAFVSVFHFSNPNDFVKMLYKLPSNKHSLMYSLGAVLPKGLILFSLLVGTSTTGLIFNESYKAFYRDYNIPIFMYLFSLLVFIYLAVGFYKKEREVRESLLVGGGSMGGKF
ncbi:MAG: hypothetical protein JKX73_00375 [Flavobacteriales bacterium]|nr:hypothetical protein [Flavobacteriales bacterium]